MTQPTVTISDFAHGSPLPVAYSSPVRDEVPWLQYFTPEQREAMKAWGAVIWPDVQVTKRMRRHMVMTPEGHRMAVFATLEECLDYAEALEVAPVGLFVCGRAILASAPLTTPPTSDPNQLQLFDVK